MFTQFASSLDRSVFTTPLIPYHRPTPNPRSSLFLKAENLQRYGCYKLRGLTAVIADMDEQELQKGLAAASAGNMAQAVAYCAKKLGVPCRIYVPKNAPDIKKRMILELGAEVVETTYEEVWGFVNGETLPPEDRFFIHPVLNRSILRGYGTIGHEILQTLPNVDAVVIPFGVGGLTLGIGKAIKSINSDVAIIACEPETACPLRKSLEADRPCSVDRVPSFVDAIGTPEVLPSIFDELKGVIDKSLVLSLSEIREGLGHLFLRQKLVCEGAAACALAGALKLAKEGEHHQIVAILSGGNISLDTLNQILNES